MRGTRTFSWSFISLALVALVFSACSKKEQIKPEENSAPVAANADENQMGDSDSGKAFGLQTVHFGYDSFGLGEETKRQLKANAQILKDKPGLKVQIEGHCDERGGIQYNIALGEKRANAARKYLADAGIQSDRLTIISFGKERPLDSAQNETAFAKNRRANFAVTSK